MKINADGIVHDMSTSDGIRVLKRQGHLEALSYDKMLRRVKNLGALLPINYARLIHKVLDQLYDQIPTAALDELMAEQCASLSAQSLDYATLASRLIVANHHRNTLDRFSACMAQLYHFKDIHGAPKPMLHADFWQLVQDHAKQLDALVDYERDYLFDYFGFKTLERSYLMKIHHRVVERPQHMWLRVALGIHGADLAQVRVTYDLMSRKYFTHATPTLFNAGTPRPQLSSCFLLAMADDSIDGIYSTLKDCANISKWAGGIGLHLHNVRATGSHIGGTNGTSNGIAPMLRVFNMTARYVDQGGGKRNGSFAMYVEPWHADIEAFLALKKNHGDEDMRARDLFYALWLPDHFMAQVQTDGDWALFCPHECPGLADCYGDDFNRLYADYVAQGRFRKIIKARTLWFQILDSQMETGTPYLLYKDAANRKSNQKNLGVIKSSNLCTEIIEYSNENETAVCNLASLGLSNYVRADGTFDYAQLHHVTQVVTRNLNRVIDVTYYPTEKTRRSNLAHRPLGIGVQGLADVFALMDLAFTSATARTVNRLIFETIYHAALTASCALAERDGPYSSFAGSPASKGQLQFDLWGQAPISQRYDWAQLRSDILRHGLRNSLLVAPMPTASTAQILGNNECFEPFTSNIYTRRTNAGEFIVVNKYLMAELAAVGLWSDAVKDHIILNKGSVQHLPGLSAHLKEKYKIVWEIPMKCVIDLAADRGIYICQSQSMNLWMEDPDYKALTSMHFYSWRAGLKTGMYYLRRKAKHQPQQFTIAPPAQTDNACESCAA